MKICILFALCLTAVTAVGNTEWTPRNQYLRKLSQRILEESEDPMRMSKHKLEDPQLSVNSPPVMTGNINGDANQENDPKVVDRISMKDIVTNPGAALEHVVRLTESMGSLGMAYFGLVYFILDLLAIPAFAFTVSAGYLFGPIKGTAIVLLSASIAAGLSFFLGRFLLRGCVESALKGYPKFAKLDRAIGKEGFKLIILLRLSPMFPFALSNYFFGASSINFLSFFAGTILGFAPGTFAYVYSGYVGKALTDASSSSGYPWYVYLGGLIVWVGILKLIINTATRVLEEIEAEEARIKADGEAEEWHEDIEDAHRELVTL